MAHTKAIPLTARANMSMTLQSPAIIPGTPCHDNLGADAIHIVMPGRAPRRKPDSSVAVTKARPRQAPVYRCAVPRNDFE